MHRKLLNWWAFCHGMASLLGVRYHWASENVSKSVDVATEASQPFSFTTFCIQITKHNTPIGFKCFLNPCIAPFIQVDHGGAQAVNCIYCEWADGVDCIPPSLSPSGITFRGSDSLHETGMGHLRSWLLPSPIPSLETHIINTVNTASSLWHTGQLHTYILQPDILTFYTDLHLYGHDIQVPDCCSICNSFSAQNPSIAII